MADIPTPRSYNQLLGDSIDVLLSKVGLKGLKVGGPFLSILETAALGDARVSQDQFQNLNSRDIDRAEGDALIQAGASEGLAPLPATQAVGTATIGDSSFTKITSRIYQGKSAPVAGSTVINIADGSQFPGSGQIYVGRGSTNLEGPLSFTSVALDSSGAFWKVTLSAATTKFHNLSESVTLAQGGNRTVSSGTIASTPQGNAADAVSFTIVGNYTIPDGEISLDGVAVTCQQTGPLGNIPAGALSVFQQLPFAGATITNALKYSNAQVAETKEQFRERIKSVRASRSKGVSIACTTAVYGISATDENARVTSSSVVSSAGQPDTIYLDDGTGYEPKYKAVAIESIIDQATGGEIDAQIVGGLPVAKAFVKSTLTAPFSLVDGSTLNVFVGGSLSTASFIASQFRDITSATAYEVVAAINGTAGLLFSARTADNATSVVIFAKNDAGEDLQVQVATSGTDANTFLGFSLARVDSVRLYKNDQLLYKDGLFAAITTNPQSAWQSTMATGETLILSIDGTSPVTYTFTDTDFANSGTGYATVSATNSLAAWATVINNKIPGITATVATNAIKLQSNLGASSRAALSIDLTSTLIAKGMFSSTALTATGRNNDYAFNRNTGELRLALALAKGDKLSAGTIYTRAYIESSDFATQTVGPLGANLWFVVDGAAKVLATGVSASTALTVASTQIAASTSYLVTLTCGTSIFGNVKKGDWLIFWDPSFFQSTATAWGVGAVKAAGALVQPTIPNGFIFRAVTGGTTGGVEPVWPTTSGGTVTDNGITWIAIPVGNVIGGSLLGTWRVAAATGTVLTIEVGNLAGALTGVVSPASGGLVAVRSDALVQNLFIPSGVQSPASLATLAAALVGVNAATIRTTRTRITTNSFGSAGDIALVAADSEGAKLPFKVATVLNEPSHLGSVETAQLDYGTPNFNFVTVQSVSGAVITAQDTDVGGFTRGARAVWLKPLPTTAAPNRYGRNTGDRSRADTVTSTTLTLQAINAIPCFGDRLYAAMPYALGPEAAFTVVLDGDTLGKNFSIPLAQKVAPLSAAIGYYGTNVYLAAGDGTGTSLSSLFGTAFNFSSFALYTQARAYTNPPADADVTVNSVLWRFARWGPDGAKARISFTNPTAPNAGYTVSTTPGDILDIFVGLPGGAARAPTLGQKYSVQTSLYGGGAALRQCVFSAGARFTMTSNGTVVTATLVGASNPYMADHGFQTGDKAYIIGPVYAQGVVTITRTNATVLTFTYDNAGLTPANLVTDTANLLASNGGVVTQPSLTGTLVGDILTVGAGTLLAASAQGTFRVADFDATQGLWVMCHRATGAVLNLGYQPIVSASNFQIYPIDTSKTNTTGTPNLATLVNAVAGNVWVQAAIPVWTKTGLGIVAGSAVTISTLDAYLEDQTKPQNGFLFSGGTYYVSASQYNTGTAPNQYQFTIAGTASTFNLWSSNEDWTNERAFLVPNHASSLSRYLNTPGVAGIAANAEIKTSFRNGKLQIASLLPGSSGSVGVTGGVANAVLAPIFDTAIPTSTGCKVQIRSSDAVGLFGGIYVAAQGTGKLPKAVDWLSTTTFAFSTVTPSTSRVTLVGGTAAKYAGSMTAAVAAKAWQIEKHGRFACYIYTPDNSPATPAASWAGISEGDWVTIVSATGSASNKGTFRVVRSIFHASGGGSDPNKYAFWVENTSAIEENATLDTVTFYTYDSVLPGDTLIINNSALGSANQGSWVVTAIDAAVAGVVSSFVVQAALSTAAAPVGIAGATALGAGFRQTQVLPAAASRLIKRIAYLAPSATSGYMDVVLDTQGGMTTLSSGAGTFLQPLDKFGFSTSVATGLDGYEYNSGLIGEAQRVLYGDNHDTTTYPGVLAKGARMNITGPLVRRIQVSLAVRVRQGTTKDVLGRVQSAVAGVINAAGVGKSIALSDVVSAAARIPGVTSATMVSPIPSAAADLISVQSFEKPMVLNLDTDVLVSLIGT